MIERMKFWDIKVLSNALFYEMCLVLVKCLQSIFHVAECDGVMSGVLCKVDKIKERVAGNDGFFWESTNEAA